MEARASPLKPYVISFARSEKVEILEVVKRSAKIGKSLFYAVSSQNTGNAMDQDGQPAHPYAAAVVLYLQEFHTTILDCDAYRGGTRIQAILNELFES